MKTAYMRPQIQEDFFAINEYVSSCFSVSCEIGSGSSAYALDFGSKYMSNGSLDGDYSGLTKYKANTCLHGDLCGSQTIISSSKRIYQNGDYVGKLIRQIDDRDNSGGMSIGDAIYWVTEDSDEDGELRHFGILQEADTYRVNRS